MGVEINIKVTFLGWGGGSTDGKKGWDIWSISEVRFGIILVDTVSGFPSTEQLPQHYRDEDLVGGLLGEEFFIGIVSRMMASERSVSSEAQHGGAHL